MKPLAGLLAAFALLTLAAIPATAGGTVARSQFTTSIQDREPTDNLSAIPGNVDQDIFFFTEFHGMEGSSVSHRWIYNGEVRAALTFKIHAWRWRTYSSKRLVSEWVGDWTVEVVDEAGTVLVSKTIGHAKD